MKLILTNQEDLEVLVQTSVKKTMEKFYQEKSSEKDHAITYSVKDTAAYLNVSELTVRNYIKRGLIEAEKIGHKIFINRENLLKALKGVKSLKYKRS